MHVPGVDWLNILWGKVLSVNETALLNGEGSRQVPGTSERAQADIYSSYSCNRYFSCYNNIRYINKLPGKDMG